MPNAKKEPSGRWRVRVYSHTDHSGKKIYRSFYGNTKKEAEYKALEFQMMRKQTPEQITVEEAMSRYIKSKDGVLSPVTIMGYENILKHHLKPIMQYRICDLTQEIVQQCINEEAKAKSPKTVANVYGLFSAAIKMQDPSKAFYIRLPRKVKQIRRELPTSDIVIQAVRGTEIELPVLLSLWLCLRLSEVRGIRKSAVHDGFLEINQVKVVVRGKDVVKELAKTDASRRLIHLPKLLEDMICKCDTEYITMLSGRALYGRFKKMMEKCGYNIRFHDLRHIAASDMNKLGIPDKVASERGGWATTATMRSVYQHSFSSDRIEADNIINSYYESLMKDECESEQSD